MTGEERSWLQRFIIWREKNVKEKRFILVLSFLVGIFTAFAALILKLLIGYKIFLQRISTQQRLITSI